MSAIDNQGVLQACTTTLAGVLIFLTIERKFIVRNIMSDILPLVHRLDDLRSRIKLNEKELERLQNEQQHYKELRSTMQAKELENQVAKSERGSVKKMMRTILDLATTDEETASNIKRFKEIEDITTLGTLVLLTMCIIFMVTINFNWKFYILDFSNVSRSLFAVGLLFLLIRVYLRTKDLSEFKLDIKKIREISKIEVLSQACRDDKHDECLGVALVESGSNQCQCRCHTQ